VELDKFLLAVGARRVAEETWNGEEYLNPRQRAYIQAYADGVNAFI